MTAEIQRFAFGKNWRRFLKLVDAQRVASAEESIQTLFGKTTLAGKRFLDAGCGSGLFSLAAVQLGASVVSFDYDAEAVACTQELKRRFAPDQNRWVITRGSVLDESFLKSLGQFDIVYSWGVLHHTGSLWKALDCVHPPVRPKGYLCVAIYNDQGGSSRRWAKIKAMYNSSPKVLQWLLIALVGLYFEGKAAGIRWLKGNNSLPLSPSRGMSRWVDLVDWVGGYPFEVATPEAIFDFFRKRSMILIRLKTCGGGHGCNEFVFKKVSMDDDEPKE